MKTDDLIDALARETEPAKPPPWRMQLGLTVLAGLALAVTLVVIGLGVREDIAAARMPVMMKALFAALTAALMLPMAVHLMKPGRSLGWRVGAVVAFLAVCAIATLIALMSEEPGRRMAAWTGGGFPWCLVLVPVLAAPTAAGLLWLMRGFAPTRLALAGAAIGAFSGGVGAMAYAMYCPVDSIAFVTTWYVLAIALCAALGSIIGSKILRW